MTPYEHVIIVGGGPAGAYCAYELACNGIRSKLFDHSHPREKPCGGGVSKRAIEKFPFLEEFRSQGNTSAGLRIISCKNREAMVLNSSLGFNLSRQFLDEQILNMAVDAGAEHIKEKVINIERIDDLWQVNTAKRSLTSKIIVGADGINSLLRKKTIGKIDRKNLGLAYGYLVTGIEKIPTTLKFVAEIPGYIWLFPRAKSTSIGIGSELKYGIFLKKILDDFIHSNYPNVNLTSNYAAMLPWATNPRFFTKSRSRDNCILIGDAAGFADPLTGEGILYALWSGKLAAEALAKNNLRLYDQLWMGQFGNYLQERCKQRKQYFNPSFMEILVASQNLKTKVNLFKDKIHLPMRRAGK